MNLKQQLPLILITFLGLFCLNTEAKTTATVCAIIGDSTVCENDVESYTSGYTGSYQYTWGVYGGSILGAPNLPSIAVNWGYAGSGQVTMIVKDSLNQVVCTKILNVTINPLPVPKIIPSFIGFCSVDTSKNGAGGDKRNDVCVSVCDSTWVSYSTNFHAGSTYTWIVNGAITYTSSSNIANVYWGAAGLGTVKVIETSAAGCIGVHDICIEIVPRPNAIFTTLPAAVGGIVNICLNQSVFFDNASLTSGGSPIYTYEWIFGDGASQILTAPTSGDISHTYATAGTYTAWLVVTNECGCKDSASIIVIVDSSPGPDIFCISTVCPGSAITYSTSAVCSTYNWVATNGTIIGASNLQNVTVQWSGVSPAVISLSVPCGSFCPSPTTLVVPVIPTTANYAGDTTLCFGECGELYLDCAIPIDSIIWHVPAGITVMTDTINRHHIKFCGGYTSLIGTIWVEYFHNTNGSTVDLECGGNLFIPIKVLPRFYLFGGTTYCEGDAFSYFPGVTNATTINWVIKDNAGTILTSTTLPSTSSLAGSWVWGPGTFSVTATDALGKHCNKTEKLIITVNPRPSAPAISGQDTVCPNNTYTYAGLVANLTESVNWSVTGGTPLSGTGNTINITWGAFPPYIINAVSVDVKTGCKSISTVMNVYSALPLTASIINGPDTVCSNGYASYSTSSVGSNFEWSINPSIAGSVGTGQYTNAINCQWNNYTGNAWVVLKRTRCNQSRKDSILVYVRPPVAPAISAPASICENATFTVTASAGATTYSWNFGDGSSTVSGISATHIYTSPGNYVITLTANFGGNCPISVSATHNINVIPAPVTNISTGDPTLYCSTTPLIISTTMTIATSVGTTGWNWYQSPSTTSIGTGASYTATALGVYYVISYNAAGCSTTTYPIVIDTIPCVRCTPMNYSLTFDRKRKGCNTDSFYYSSSNVFSHAWNFGDIFNPSTNSATGNNVLHTYTEPGIYQTKLCGKVKSTSSVSTDSCLVCVTKNDTINYVPDFYANVNCINNSSSFTVTFVNITKKFALAPAPSYAWSIGAGSTLSTATNWTTALAAGTYTINLTISGVCVFSKVITIVVPTQASFTALDSVCVGAPVQFTNTAAPILGVSWNFGDGASSLLTNPIRSYSTSGTFITTQTITNQYGCTDTAQRSIVVLPNTLGGFLSLSGPNQFCLGDSVKITANPTSGYPPYTYLWNNTAVIPTITAFYTGNYGVDLYDSKGCFHKVLDTLILVNPKPNPTIIGKSEFCAGDQVGFVVASPYPANSFLYTYDGVVQPPWYGNNFSVANVVGTHQLIVQVTNSFGCVAIDTHNFVIHPKPNITITTTGSLCEGDSNILVATSTSSNVFGYYWSTGLQNDTLITAIPNTYVATVLDSNGCKATANVNIHRLPDLCGLMTGCYEICDTVTLLVWHAPKGYASYQWYFNGVPISGATSDTIHIPLYQSGAYTVSITSGFGCSITSDDINIQFVHCGGCELKTQFKIDCGPINLAGNQTYYLTFSLNNTLTAGANVTLSSPDGTVTSLAPATAALGMNTFTAVFTDIPPITGIACFTLSIWDRNNRCDTTFCVKLPNCKQDCGARISVKEPFDCVGYDGSGNPQYYGCVNVFWPGSNGATITLVAPNSSFSPNPQTVNNGSNTICFTYTDLPSYNPGFIKIYAYFYDTVKHITCCDSFIIEYKPCKERCELGVVGLCAHCYKQTTGGLWSYVIEMDITNTFGTSANVSILPIAAGTFGAITPNPVPMGTSTISTIFTDTGSPDSIICFRVLITNPITHEICYRDICVSLPPCDELGVAPDLANKAVKIYPNPANDFVIISIDGDFGNASITLTDVNGRRLQNTPVQTSEENYRLDLSSYEAGIYFVEVLCEKGLTLRSKIVVK